MPGTFGYADPLFLLIAALALEAYLGRGNWLGSLSRGPRRWVARLARTLEQRLNRPERGAAERRRRGWIVAIALVLLGGLAGWLLALFTRFYPFAWPLELLLLLLVVRQRSTWGQGIAVVAALEHDKLPAARVALARLTAGDLDPFLAEQLPPAAGAALAVRAVARRLNDGLVGPVFWYVMLGPGGLLVQQMSLLLARLYGGVALHDREQEAPAGIFGQGAIRLYRFLAWAPAQVSALLLLGASRFPGEPAQGEAAGKTCWAGVGRRWWPEQLLASLAGSLARPASALRLALDLFRKAALIQAALLVLLLLARLILS